MVPTPPVRVQVPDAVVDQLATHTGQTPNRVRTALAELVEALGGTHNIEILDVKTKPAVTPPGRAHRRRPRHHHVRSVRSARTIPPQQEGTTMSYDVSLYLTGGTDATACVLDENHTRNTAAMWRKAGCDLADFDGKNAGEVGPTIANAAVVIRENCADYEPLAPDNGWGTVDSTIAFLERIATGCREFPNATMRVSY